MPSETGRERRLSELLDIAIRGYHQHAELLDGIADATQEMFPDSAEGAREAAAGIHTVARELTASKARLFEEEEED